MTATDVGDWALAVVMVGEEGAKREHSERIRIQKITNSGIDQIDMCFLP